MSNTRQDAAASIIKYTLPRWFIDATPQMRDALRLDMTRRQQARLDANRTLEKIQDLPTFARPLLAKALDAEFGAGLNVDNDCFFHVRFERDWLTDRAAPKASSTQSLLAAALQNFEADEAQDADRESTSAIYRNRPEVPALEAGTSVVHPLNVSPRRFIELCRRLDLGGQYQRHLNHVLHPVARPDIAGSVGSEAIKFRIIESKRLSLRVEAHVARLKGLISDVAYQTLLSTAVQGAAPQVFTLQLLGFRLRDALLFQASGQSRCVVYLPGDPEAPIAAYASLDQFAQALRTKLRSEDYQRYFDRFIAQRSKPAFFARLHERLAPHALHSVARGSGFHRQLISVSEPDQNADLDMQMIPLGGALGDFFYLQQLLRIKDDARILAVPTDDEDQKSRSRRLAQWLDYGMDALNVAAFFVPGLGEAMLLVAGAQLLTETFEGVHAWQHGDMDEALQHLSSVAENLAFMGVLGAAGASAHGFEPPVIQPSSFIERMVPVRHVDGSMRLTDTATAFRRLHPSLAGFDDKTVTRIMAVSRVDEDILGHLHLNNQAPPAALSDTAKRFHLSQQAADSARVFEAAYVGSEQSSDPLIVLLRRDFPALTLSSAQELIAGASAEQISAMQSSQRIPLEVGGKVRGHLHQTRMNRALEGFFLTPSRASADLQRLALHSVRTFPGWPADLRIEIRDSTTTGPLLDGIGPENAARRRVLVRSRKAFLPCDGEGNPLGREGSLFSALLRAMPEDSRKVMGLGEPDVDARALKRRIFTWLKGQPKWAARTLGQWTMASDFNRPLRLTDGRIGYPLSGRGPVLPAADSALQQALLHAMTHLYPESIELPEQVRSMARRGRPLAQLLAATQARAEAYSQLHASLIAWAEADDISVLLNEGERLARRRTANALGQAWRYSHDAAPRGLRSLTLEYIALPELPPLPGFYAEITHIEFVHLQPDTASANAFLANFPALTHLNVRGSFTEIPSVLPQLQQLEHLSLENMPWTVDQAAMNVLMNIPALDSLSLAGSPLGNFTDTGDLRLSTLWINNTGLTQWPQWAHSLGLEELDISDNQITDILDEVIENPADPDRHLVIYAYNNPFEHQALEHYWRNDTGYGHRYQLDYDFPQDIRELPVADASMNTQSESSDDEGEPHGHRARSSGRVPMPSAQMWVREGEQVLNERFLGAWARVEEAGDAPHLLTLLQRLRETPDFRLFHAELASDVLTVLEAVAQDSGLRGQVEVMANDRLFGANQTCQDGARLIFSDIQVAVYSHQSLQEGTQTQRTEGLFGVIRQLFRLNQVQAIADAEIARREGLSIPVDHAEVRLAYRIGLADDLGLPGQPQRMAWVRLAAVDRGALLDARRRVLEAERSPAFLQFAVNDRQWSARMRAEHGAGLESAGAEVRARMTALEENPPADPDDYHQQGLALIAQREAAENLMLSQLTDLYRASW